MIHYCSPKRSFDLRSFEARLPLHRPVRLAFSGRFESLQIAPRLACTSHGRAELGAGHIGRSGGQSGPPMVPKRYSGIRLQDPDV